MSQSFAATPGYRRLVGRRIPARFVQLALRCAFIGVWVVLPLLPLTAVLLTWLRGL